MKTRVWATYRFTGFHAWPGAPGERLYLAFRHRHVFHVKATVPVTHDDRAIEFHDLVVNLREMCLSLGPATDDGAALELGSLSCEMIAVKLASYLAAKYSTMGIRVEVSEDGENGSEIEI